MADQKTLLIQGESFTASQPYDEGHVLSAVEAKTLNQVRCENLRNNFAKFVKESKEGKEGALTAEQLIAAFAKYDTEYTFASPGVARAKMDPVEREARSLAKDILKNHLATQNRTFKMVPAGMTQEEWDEKIEARIVQVAAMPDVLKTAKANVSKRSALVSAAGAELDL